MGSTYNGFCFNGCITNSFGLSFSNFFWNFHSYFILRNHQAIAITKYRPYHPFIIHKSAVCGTQVLYKEMPCLSVYFSMYKGNSRIGNYYIIGGIATYGCALFNCITIIFQRPCKKNYFHLRLHLNRS